MVRIAVEKSNKVGMKLMMSFLSWAELIPKAVTDHTKWKYTPQKKSWLTYFYPENRLTFPPLGLQLYQASWTFASIRPGSMLTSGQRETYRDSAVDISMCGLYLWVIVTNVNDLSGPANATYATALFPLTSPIQQPPTNTWCRRAGEQAVAVVLRVLPSKHTRPSHTHTSYSAFTVCVVVWGRTWMSHPPCCLIPSAHAGSFLPLTDSVYHWRGGGLSQGDSLLNLRVMISTGSPRGASVWVQGPRHIQIHWRLISHQKIN